MIKGMLFDMDCVFVDSESFICKKAEIMFSKDGVKILSEGFYPSARIRENKYINKLSLVPLELLN